jgi:hypothetical protein
VIGQRSIYPSASLLDSLLIYGKVYWERGVGPPRPRSELERQKAFLNSIKNEIAAEAHRELDAKKRKDRESKELKAKAAPSGFGHHPNTTPLSRIYREVNVYLYEGNKTQPYKLANSDSSVRFNPQDTYTTIDLLVRENIRKLSCWQEKPRHLTESWNHRSGAYFAIARVGKGRSNSLIRLEIDSDSHTVADLLQEIQEATGNKQAKLSLVMPVERSRSPSIDDNPFTLPELPGRYRRSGSSSIVSKTMDSSVPSTTTSQFATSSIASSKLRQTLEPDSSDFEFPDTAGLVDQMVELQKLKSEAIEIKLEKLEQQEDTTIITNTDTDIDVNSGTDAEQSIIEQAIKKGSKRAMEQQQVSTRPKRQRRGPRRFSQR